MKQELQDKLFENYPKIFGQKDLSPRETAMCWGIECGDGWYTLIDRLCYSLQFNTDHNNRPEQGNEGRYPQVEAVQVKEKWGGLRFYTNGATDVQQGAIDFAELMSYHICEYCGSTDDVQQTKGYVQSLCVNCRTEKDKENIQ